MQTLLGEAEEIQFLVYTRLKEKMVLNIQKLFDQ